MSSYPNSAPDPSTAPASSGSVGLSGLAVYLPPWRVDLQAWCRWTDNDAEKVRQVVGDGFRLLGPRQSIYTLAANAVLRLIRQYEVDARRIRFLGLGTESSTDNSAGAIIVKGMVDDALRTLGLPGFARQCEVPEFKHACLGGVYALKSALRFLETDAEDDALAIVVCADKALYELGSSGEPTQGAGAVAMLLERNPRIGTIDLRRGGSASAYRIVDFRKPLTGRLNGEAPVLDIPVFNGRYSTNCYLDAVRESLADMYRRRKTTPAECLRSLAAAFLHRPYHRMPETGWGLAWLFALGAGDEADRAELAMLCQGAGLTLDDVLAEMRAPAEVHRYAVADRIQDEIFPLTMTVLKVFRRTEFFRRHVQSQIELGSRTMREMGNLYTGALPAWLAAGLTEAAASPAGNRRSLDGREVLLVGYGSGDAAEAIPVVLVPGWHEAARHIGVAEALAGAVDVTEAQYRELRMGRTPEDLQAVPSTGEFVVDRIGQQTGRRFQDAGVEYYRFVR